MKNVKKLLSILVVLTLVLSLGATAFAAEITLPDEAKDHTMVAYQIFAGAQNEQSATDQLGVTGWGANISEPDTFLVAMAAAYPEGGFEAGMTAVEAAEAIGKLASTSDASVNVALGNAIAAAVKAQGIAGVTFQDGKADLGTGYWVIVDETTELPANESRSTVLLEVVGKALTLQDKIDQPTVDKKADGVDAEVKGLGDTVTFTLTATLPENYADYASYFLAFHDTMDAGLTFKAVSSVACGAATANVKTEEAAGYELVELPTDGCTFEVKLANVKDIFPQAKAGDTITVTYTAEVNSNAVVKNENDVKLEYSENPAKTEDHGTTPEETVVVFTFQLHGTKVEPGEEEGTYKPLEGASFTLYMKDATGDYEYNGEMYKVYREQVKAELQEDGSYAFAFDQLGKGEYLLVETVVPDGYNKAPDIYFKVVDTYGTDEQVNGAEVQDADGNKIDTNGAAIVFGAEGTVDGVIDEQVINNSGLELPETGGIGTTIFYVIGAILVAGAVILLVTRKRMSGADK